MSTEAALIHAGNIQTHFAPQLIDWQRQHGRHNLPWQQNKTPYRVWVSEIMLQQTQVATVKGYFTRFMQHFPTVQSLANAKEDDVLALWAGLGYYTRARNLWRCAQMVMEEHAGQFPSSAEVLVTLPGIGPSTAAAIASICFGQRISILDANVQRVLARLLCFEHPVNTTTNKKILQECATKLLPSESLLRKDSKAMSTYTQGLMDLGASVCSIKQPNCIQCPVQALCLAKTQNKQTALPYKTPKTAKKQENWYFVWLENAGDILLMQRSKELNGSNVWSGLWCFPQLAQPWSAKAQPADAVYSVKHELTHKKLQLHIARQLVSNRKNAEQELHKLLKNKHPENAGVQFLWATPEQLVTLGLPAPISKLLCACKKHTNQASLL